MAIVAIIHFNELAGNCVVHMHVLALITRLLFAALALCLSLLAHPCIWAQLQRRFDRDDNDIIGDIFDGQEYKKLVHSGTSKQGKCVVYTEH